MNNGKAEAHGKRSHLDNFQHQFYVTLLIERMT